MGELEERGGGGRRGGVNWRIEREGRRGWEQRAGKYIHKRKKGMITQIDACFL